MGLVCRISAGDIAMTIGESLQLGPYTVCCTLRRDNPHWPHYLIFRREKLIGKQFSMPCRSDCEWHERRKGEYAKAEESRQEFKKYGRGDFGRPRGRPRGRPTNAERALRDATLLLVTEE